MDDKYFMVSMLHKSIRRGLKKQAITATEWFLQNDPAYLFRRLEVILIEDIGIANPELVLNYLGSGISERRNRIWEFISAFCESACDRNSAECSQVVEYDPDLKKCRELYPELSDTQLEAIALDEEASIYNRLLSAWVIAGNRLFPSDHIKSGRDNFPFLMHLLYELGLPEDVRLVIELATRKRLYAMPLGFAFSYILAHQSERKVITQELVNPAMIGNIPAAALDKFTKIGKACIYELTFGCNEIYSVLAGKIPNNRMTYYVGLAIFAIESASVSKQLIYDGCNEPLEFSTRAYLVNGSFTEQDLEKLLVEVQKNLPLLNEIRAKKYEQLSKAPCQIELADRAVF